MVATRGSGSAVSTSHALSSFTSRSSAFGSSSFGRASFSSNTFAGSRFASTSRFSNLSLGHSTFGNGFGRGFAGADFRPGLGYGGFGRFGYGGRFVYGGFGCWGCGFGFGFGFGFGWGGWGGWGLGFGWDPFWYNPFWYNPYWYGAWGWPAYGYYAPYPPPDGSITYPPPYGPGDDNQQNSNGPGDYQNQNDVAPQTNIEPGYGSDSSAQSWENPNPDTGNVAESAPTVLLYMKDGSTVPATDYWVAGDKLHYRITYGGEEAIDMGQLDLQRTVDENAKRGVRFTLKPQPVPSTPAPAPATTTTSTT
jgi:hypothetical protein